MKTPPEATQVSDAYKAFEDFPRKDTWRALCGVRSSLVHGSVPKRLGRSLGEILDDPTLTPEAMRSFMTHDPANATLVIDIAYPYEIDLDRIQTPAHLLKWVLHLVGKPWMNGTAVAVFAEYVAEIKGMKIHA